MSCNPSAPCVDPGHRQCFDCEHVPAVLVPDVNGLPFPGRDFDRLDPFLPLECGEPVTTNLRSSSGFSFYRFLNDPVTNKRYYARFFTFRADVIGSYTITVDTADFSPFITAARNSNDIYQAASGMLVFDVTADTAGPFVLEVTSIEPYGVGEFTVTLECPGGGLSMRQVVFAWKPYSGWENLLTFSGWPVFQMGGPSDPSFAVPHVGPVPFVPGKRWRTKVSQFLYVFDDGSNIVTTTTLNSSRKAGKVTAATTQVTSDPFSFDLLAYALANLEDFTPSNITHTLDAFYEDFTFRYKDGLSVYHTVTGYFRVDLSTPYELVDLFGDLQLLLDSVDLATLSGQGFVTGLREDGDEWIALAVTYDLDIPETIVRGSLQPGVRLNRADAVLPYVQQGEGPTEQPWGDMLGLGYPLFFDPGGLYFDCDAGMYLLTPAPIAPSAFGVATAYKSRIPIRGPAYSNRTTKIDPLWTGDPVDSFLDVTTGQKLVCVETSTSPFGLDVLPLVDSKLTGIFQNISCP